MANTHLTHVETHTQLSIFVAFADIKKEKAAGSMQNNEVKAVLISLGDEPNATRPGAMRNEEEKNKKEKQYFRTNKVIGERSEVVGVSSRLALAQNFGLD